MMNNAQIVSIVTKVIVAASAGWIGTHTTITADQWGNAVTDIISLAVGLGATWAAHNFHGNNPPSQPK